MARFDFIISRRSDSDVYELWRADIDGPDFLSPVALNPQARFNPAHQIAQIGSYLLEWGPMMLEAYQPSFPYRLFKFDPTSADPLAGRAVQKGLWSRSKFWAYRPDFANPNGASEGYNAATDLRLLPLGGFMLNVIAMAGRATYHLWNFDPNPLSQSDPLAAPYTPQGGFDSIQQGNELIAMGNYVLDRVAATGDYRVWSFDPMGQPPLAQPAVQQGRWSDITADHRLVAMGEHVLDWTPADRQYRLWAFDPGQANPLVGPVRSGTLPEGFDAHTTLLTVQPPLPVDATRAEQPGTMDFMRSKIKHVVYLMLENRSFDHVLGWLYEKDQPATFVGHDQPFDGASETMFNIDPTQGNKKVYLQAYKNGATSETWDTTDFLPNDPYHDKSDVLRQYFFDNRNGYVERAKPDMGGFVWNNGVPEVMWTYKPQQLPVINGLAKSFAVSDEWFSSMPGATDPNRAMAFTGSAQLMLNNWQNGNIYTYWADFPRRASIWKTLWTQGITDFKLYHSVEWLGFIHTYHLYLEGQVPTIDKNKERFLSDIDTFKAEALLGKLPAFSLLEPAWIAPVGTTSSTRAPT